MVSVVVPAYNASRYLAECLDSILAQTYGDIEVIVVDDGSTDDTGTIADNYARGDSRVKVMHQDNGGLSCARNRGAAAAAGQLLTFVDSDDMLHPRFIEKMMKLREDTGAEIAMAAYIRSDKCSWEADKDSGSVAMDAQEAISHSLYQTNGMDSTAWAKLAPTALYKELPYRKGILYEDLDHFYRLYEKVSKVAVSREKLYFYRDNPGSIINTFKPARWDVIDVTRRIEERYADNPRLRRAARTRRFAANFNIYILGSIYGKGQQGMALDDCWKLVKAYRRSVLFDPKARQKDKVGAMISYLGKRAALAIAKFFY